MKVSKLFLLLVFPHFFSAQIENYYLSNKTPTYEQVIRFYDSIAQKCPFFKFTKAGATDVGKNLNLLVISADKNFDPKKTDKTKKSVLLINNGIHPGEPDGIDACINLVKEFAKDPRKIPANKIICIVPVYNIDGALQRNSVMRMNQNGPEEFGFRGNAKNLDLNRDFVKCDAENTRSLIKLFHEWKPEVVVDTHVSNGADYPYTMTLIATQRSKFNLRMSNLLYAGMLTEIYDDMKKKEMEICPYVETMKETPDSGLVEFLENPRFLTGYAALFNCVGFVTESHMLKPYAQRVKATIEILKTFIQLQTDKKSAEELLKAKSESDKEISEQTNFKFNWKLNTKEFNSFNFKGYAAEYKPSKISGLQRLYYNREKSWEKIVPYYCFYTASDSIKKPEYYVLPQAWKKVIELLELNKVKMKRLTKDTMFEVEAYILTDFKTGPRPYEGHYTHSEIKTRTEKQKLNFFKGDYVIEMNQTANRYIVEVLEPRHEDSFFAWGFFDAVLQQKEWFSDYVFEEVAEKILQENPQIKLQLDSAKTADKSLKENHWNQLNFIFQHSKYKEKSHNRYPVYRLNEKVKLPVN
jgi:hypothetical protein